MNPQNSLRFARREFTELKGIFRMYPSLLIHILYKYFGPGLFESVYEEALCHQLQWDGLKVEKQVDVPLYYNGVKLNSKLRVDILVEDSVIVELKSVKEIEPVHHKQLLTYLKICNKHIGILVNFDTEDINNSIYRKINGYTPQTNETIKQ